MLDEWRPLMCPFDVTMLKAVIYFDYFLPTCLPAEAHGQGFRCPQKATFPSGRFRTFSAGKRAQTIFSGLGQNRWRSVSMKIMLNLLVKLLLLLLLLLIFIRTRSACNMFYVIMSEQGKKLKVNNKDKYK